MDIQRLRNLTTGRLHTRMSDIYEDIEYLVGEKGIMTHMLPNACKSLCQVYLMHEIKEDKFWDGQYDPTHLGDFDILPMPSDKREAFWKCYETLQSPLDNTKIKKVIALNI